MNSIYQRTPQKERVKRFNRLSEAMVGQPKSQGAEQFYDLPDLWNKKSFNKRFTMRPQTSRRQQTQRLPPSRLSNQNMAKAKKKQKDYSALKKEIREREKGCKTGKWAIFENNKGVLVGDISKLAENLRQEVKRAKRDAGFFDDDSSSPETSLATML
ncbi:hypothetical protein TrCOL_g11028 [Triparma columacea]|uniref:Uncharacterized protein n=1 Tax=Triparma columacea TaxID=722753 RepID=A0A9W7L8Q2_9STRA|nr:hypothetical protein TrCOL_g11028 [Triparma columacea]